MRAIADRPKPANAAPLRAPANPVSPRAPLHWLAQGLAGVTGWAVPFVVLAVLLPVAAKWLLFGLAVTGVPALIAVVAAALLRARNHRWEVTGDAVISRTGSFWQEWRIAPVQRLQTVDSVRGPLQQVFGLATVTLTTASAKGPLRISGLRRADADGLVDRLTRATAATPGDDAT